MDIVKYQLATHLHNAMTFLKRVPNVMDTNVRTVSHDNLSITIVVERVGYPSRLFECRLIEKQRE